MFSFNSLAKIVDGIQWVALTTRTIYKQRVIWFSAERRDTSLRVSLYSIYGGTFFSYITIAMVN